MPRASWMNAAVFDMKETVANEAFEEAWHTTAGMWATYGQRSSHELTSSTMDSWAVWHPRRDARKSSTVVPVAVTVAYLAWWVAVAWWRLA